MFVTVPLLDAVNLDATITPAGCPDALVLTVVWPTLTVEVVGAGVGDGEVVVVVDVTVAYIEYTKFSWLYPAKLVYGPFGKLP